MKAILTVFSLAATVLTSANADAARIHRGTTRPTRPNFEHMMPETASASAKRLARNIDQAMIMTIRNFNGCEPVLQGLSRDAALIATAEVLDSNKVARENLADMTVALSRSLGGCLMKDQISGADRYVENMLDNAGSSLVLLAVALKN